VFKIAGNLLATNCKFNASEDAIFGAETNTTRNYEAGFDELGIWTRALTDAEVTQLYNAGDGMTYNDFGTNDPLVTSITPEANKLFLLNPSSVNFTCNATARTFGATIKNISLISNGFTI
jgi:hypothetical protein